MIGEHEDASALAMGLEGWDSFEPMAGGKGGVSRAQRAGRPYVVKTYTGTAAVTGAVRERAALTALGGAAGTPRLLAVFEEPAGIVMDHLDGSTSVADLLLGTDPRSATEALVCWGEALAHLHTAGTTEVRTAFEDELGRSAPDLPARTLASDFDRAAERYAVVLAELNLGPHYEALEELRGLPASLASETHEVLSPADTCPDNNVIVGDAVVLIDFEHAEIRHRAWDVAYLLAPWPSCWCAWLLPDDTAAAAVAGYRRLAGVDDDGGFDLDLATATVGWQAMTPGWFIEGALASDDRTDPPTRPSRRAFVLHRLAARVTQHHRPRPRRHGLGARRGATNTLGRRHPGAGPRVPLRAVAPGTRRVGARPSTAAATAHHTDRPGDLYQTGPPCERGRTESRAEPLGT